MCEFDLCWNCSKSKSPFVLSYGGGLVSIIESNDVLLMVAKCMINNTI